MKSDIAEKKLFHKIGRRGGVNPASKIKRRSPSSAPLHCDLVELRGELQQ